METLLHQISHSEIKYGIIQLRKTDGTKNFFKDLPERFDISLRGELVRQRTLMPKTIWMGFEIMKKFRPYEVIKLVKKGDIIHIE